MTDDLTITRLNEKKCSTRLLVEKFNFTSYNSAFQDVWRMVLATPGTYII